MAAHDSLHSELFDYPEVADSLQLNVAGESLTVQRPLHQGMPRQEGPMAGLKLLVILMAGLFVFAYVFGSRRSLFLHSVKDIFVYRERSSIFVESDIGLLRYQKMLTLLGSLIYLLLLALLLQSGEYACLGKLNFTGIWYALILQSVYLIYKYLICWIFSVFQFGASVAKQWRNDYLVLFIVLSLSYAVLLFVNEFLAIRMDLLLIIALMLWLVNKTIMLVKTAHYFYRQRLSWFHLILYLCTLEILPLCFLYQGIIWIRDIV